MPVFVLSFAAISGLITVVLGALAAHFLKSRLTESALSSFETGVLYQMFHTLVLLVLGILILRYPNEVFFSWSAISMMLGMILFSGSIYALSLWGFKVLGPITPLGGLAFMIGWLLLALAVWRSV